MTGVAPHRLAGHVVLLDRSGVMMLPEMDTLVVADLHLEKGSSFARRGMMLPPYDTGETLKRLGAVMDYWRPGRVVALGDSFHDDGGAGRMNIQDRSALHALMEGRDWIWIAGNHDPAPPEGLPGRSMETLKAGNLVFRHEPLPGAVDGEVAGHLHPGARVVQRGRAVRAPCFASDGSRMILPAFGAYAGCLNVRHTAYAGLFDWSRFCAFMLGEERVFCVRAQHLVPD
ncbi:ligase-associated DNA damage response endonuclease PdeM [Notoacmeibacter sp. MSK16QG-6]|uniref:ligase-associated DNA damage response endonuclease PdeM n=1 Tax=Notoacmeibacter sp. MSK16QG-6 TaxID=2957982 RepID=UPI00209F9F62|nr:ligase-associated DNA damage response endonuclease PdeM [Notoacmeibacter sp. MSK16QG-6]MCP1198635.1 ligase-associated DNA damage response endonuclease PdeM [Notoacmeibacter sp. MSK16QG-6]